MIIPLALLTAVFSMAASASGQTFDSRVGEISQTVSLSARQARLDLAMRKKPLANPPAGISVGGPKDGNRRAELDLFEDGWRETMRLLSGEKGCAKFFADHGHPLAQVMQTLAAAHYHFLKMQDGVGAATIDAGTVFINSNGVFVNAVDGGITLDHRRYDLQEPSDVRAMILMHELGHQLGIFGVDYGRPELKEVNAAHSLDIIRACLPGSAMPKL